MHTMHRVRRAALAFALLAALSAPAAAESGGTVGTQGLAKAIAYFGCASGIVMAYNWNTAWMAAATCMRLYLLEDH